MFYSLANRPDRSHQRPASQVVSNLALEKFLDDTLGSLSGARSKPSATVEDGDKAYFSCFKIFLSRNTFKKFTLSP